MKNKTKSNFETFALAICFIGLAFIMGYLCGKENALTEGIKKPDALSLAGVSPADSISFENAAELATFVDLPEETPETGDSMCAYVRNDTVFLQYWHNYPSQKNLFKFRYNY